MRKIVKLIGIVVGGLIVLLVAAAVVLVMIGDGKLNQTYSVEHEYTLPETASAEQEQGQHLAKINGCIGCHGADLGGTAFIDEIPLGYIPAPNLTAGEGGIGAGYTDSDFERAVRHGVAPSGRSLLIMPSNALNQLSDEDLGHIIAYIRSVEPVDQAWSEPQPHPVLKILLATGLIPAPSVIRASGIDHDAEHPAVRPTDEVELGFYLTRTCVECHQSDLAGGTNPAGPPSPVVPANLTPHPEGLGDWTEEDFINALRSGVTPDGRNLDPEAMPWPEVVFNDEEMHAVWLYLQTLEPKADRP